MGLVNKETLTQEDLKILLEQYKLYVEMADRISQRRMNANTFFISVNTLLFAVIPFSRNIITFWYVVVALLGSILCFMWYFILNSYSQLNSGKFKVIHEIEKLLPLSSYSYEWELLGKGTEKSKYWRLSHIEKMVPIVFFVMYVIFVVCYIVKDILCGIIN